MFFFLNAVPFRLFSYFYVFICTYLLKWHRCLISPTDLNVDKSVRSARLGNTETCKTNTLSNTGLYAWNTE